MCIININTRTILICLLWICCEGCIVVCIYIFTCIHKFTVVRKHDVMEACSESRRSFSFTDLDVRHIWAISFNTIEWAACIHGGYVGLTSLLDMPLNIKIRACLEWESGYDHFLREKVLIVNPVWRYINYLVVYVSSSKLKLVSNINWLSYAISKK
jgi:hypothetical protein